MVNRRETCPCPYCWRVLYSKAALTKHINEEHWREKEEDDERQTD